MASDSCVRLFWCVCAAWLWPAVVHAEPTPSERETARALMQAGDRARADGDLQSALRSYRGAFALVRVPTTGLPLAQTQAQLQQLVEAVSTAMDIVNLQPTASEPRLFTEARSAALSLATTLGPRIPSLRTRVTPATASYRLTIDGQLVPADAHDLPFKLDPTAHSVQVTAPGYAAEVRQVILAEGEVQTLAVALTPLPEPEPHQAAPAPEAPAPALTAAEPPRSGPAAASGARPAITPGTVAALSLGAAAFALGAMSGFTAVVQSAQYRDRCTGDADQGGLCGRLHSQGRVLQTVADVGILLGLAGLGYGVYQLVAPSGGAPERDHARGARLELAGSGLVLRGQL